jgi:hypothetical protein
MFFVDLIKVIIENKNLFWTYNKYMFFIKSIF